MVPELTAETEFRLKAHELEIRQAATVRPDALTAPMVALLWQTAAQESIIRKATRRIAELEAREAVTNPRASRKQWEAVAREFKTMPWWMLLVVAPLALLGRKRRQ
jgi:hypothetical protein